MGTKVYFFAGDQYARYDRGNDLTDSGFPLPINGNWGGLGAFGYETGFDSAVNWGNGKLFFFKGDQYIRYDIATDKIDAGYPLAIKGQWPGFDAVSFDTDLDAVVNWGNGKAFFFKGDKYLRYDIATDKIDAGYPLPISVHWPGFDPAGFASGVDAALAYGNGKAFFFKGDKYLRYDIAADAVDPGYPLAIAGLWPGLPAPLTSNLSAVIDILDLTKELWVPSATVALAPVTGPKFLPLPWRGVLHTTEGGKADGAISSFRSTNFWPHFTTEPATGKVFQHLPLNIGARALSDHGVTANAAHAIQIEMAGFARETPTWSPAMLANVRALMREIEKLVPIPRTSGRTFLGESGVNHTPGNRMTATEWPRFTGWSGHQHVPGESHWDPGAIDIAALLL